MKLAWSRLGVILLLVVCCRAAWSASVALSSELEQAVLEERWAELGKALTADTSRARDAVSRMLAAHACLANGENNLATALFATVIADPEVQAWHEWTDSFLHAHPDAAVAMYLHADACARSGELEQAAQLLEAATELRPQSPLAWNALAVVHALSEDLDQALVDLVQAKAVAPGFAATHANLGWVMYLRCAVPRSAEAQVAGFDEAISLDPSFALALNGRGCVRYAAGAYDLAMADFQAARAACPALFGTSGNLAIAEGAATWLIEATSAVLQASGQPGSTIESMSKQLTERIEQSSLGLPLELRQADWVRMQPERLDQLVNSYGAPTVHQAMNLAYTQHTTEMMALNSQLAERYQKQATQGGVAAYAQGFGAAAEVAGALMLGKTYAERGWEPFLGSAGLTAMSRLPDEATARTAQFAKIAAHGLTGNVPGLIISTLARVAESVEYAAGEFAYAHGALAQPLADQHRTLCQEAVAISRLEQEFRNRYLTPSVTASPPLVDLGHRAYFTTVGSPLTEVPVITDMVANGILHDGLPKRVGVYAPGSLGFRAIRLTQVVWSGRLCGYGGLPADDPGAGGALPV